MKKFILFLFVIAFSFASCEKSDSLSEIETNLKTLDTDIPVEHERVSDLAMASL